MPLRDRSNRLPANVESALGEQAYTSIGQAEADLTSAQMALGALLQRRHLTPAQRRDFRAALTATERAAAAVGRHIDYGEDE